MTIEAMKQTLNTLEGWANHGQWVWPETALEQCKRNTVDAITALRTAIEQAEKQEPKCQYPRCSCNSKDWCDPARQQALDKMAENARELGLDYEPKEKK